MCHPKKNLSRVDKDAIVETVLHHVGIEDVVLHQASTKNDGPRTLGLDGDVVHGLRKSSENKRWINK